VHVPAERLEVLRIFQDFLYLIVNDFKPLPVLLGKLLENAVTMLIDLTSPVEV